MNRSNYFLNYGKNKNDGGSDGSSGDDDERQRSRSKQDINHPYEYDWYKLLRADDKDPAEKLSGKVKSQEKQRSKSDENDDED